MDVWVAAAGYLVNSLQYCVVAVSSVIDADCRDVDGCVGFGQLDDEEKEVTLRQ
jgi:hypothetical protein